MGMCTPSVLFVMLALAVSAPTQAAGQSLTAEAPSTAQPTDAKGLYTKAMATIRDGAESDYPAYIFRAIALLTQSAEQGYPQAQFKLGYYFHTGPNSWDCLVQDPAKAYYWYALAAEQGHLEAQYELAMLYNAETGFAKFADRDKYVAWMTKAADQGYGQAQRQLARMYQTGDGVPVDPELARSWSEKAAAQSKKRVPAK
ncbi:MAG: hypothetical protein V4631_18695 [Pseudomonadota bacterium]